VTSVRPKEESPWGHSGTLTGAYEAFRGQLLRFFQVNAPRSSVVDDLMQEMFLQLLKSRPSAELRDVRAYLFQTAWSVVNATRRRLRREPEYMTSLDEPALGSQADRSSRLWVEDDTSTMLAQAQLQALLAKLPPAGQAAIVLRYREGRSYKEIAAQLDCSTSTVKKYLMHALNECRKEFELGSQEGDPT
jgi:RNA polymerase sigma factor (sigma-70 family)